MGNWTQATAGRIADASPLSKGNLLFLGAADAGKINLPYTLRPVPESADPEDACLDISSGWS